MSSGIDKIRETPNAYVRALANADVAAIVELYTPDGVLMLQHMPSQVGRKAIEECMQQFFEDFTLNVQLDLKDVGILAGGCGIVKGASSGTRRHNKTGVVTQEGIQELFLLKKLGEDRKIYRYGMCTMLPLTMVG